MTEKYAERKIITIPPNATRKQIDNLIEKLSHNKEYFCLTPKDNNKYEIVTI